MNENETDITLIESMEELALLPAGTEVEGAETIFGRDIWRMRGGYVADCISAGDYWGPISEVSLPASVRQSVQTKEEVSA